MPCALPPTKGLMMNENENKKNNWLMFGLGAALAVGVMLAVALYLRPRLFTRTRPIVLSV